MDPRQTCLILLLVLFFCQRRYGIRSTRSNTHNSSGPILSWIRCAGVSLAFVVLHSSNACSLAGYRVLARQAVSLHCKRALGKKKKSQVPANPTQSATCFHPTDTPRQATNPTALFHIVTVPCVRCDNLSSNDPSRQKKMVVLRIFVGRGRRTLPAPPLRIYNRVCMFGQRGEERLYF